MTGNERSVKNLLAKVTDTLAGALSSGTVLCLCALLLNCYPLDVDAGPIYVYKEPDGVIRFSSKPPPSGVEAKVFRAKKKGFSTYSSLSRSRRERLFVSEYKQIIEKAAKKHGVEEALVRAVIHAESAFNPRAVSPKGALGLMQLMPFNVTRLGIKDPFSPVENVRGGVRMLSELQEKYAGNLRLSLAAYNAGEEAVRKYGRVPPYRETQNYVRRVIRLMQRYSTKLNE